MIMFRHELSGIYKSVIRPISVQVLHDLKSVFNIDHTLSVSLNNQIEEFSTIQQIEPVKRPSLNPLVEELEFNVEEEYNQETLITNSANYNEYRPFIYDKDVGAWIRGVYVDTKINFTIKFLSKSKSNVERLINEFKIRLSQSESINIHSASYSFYIPDKFIELFLDIYELKEEQVPTGKSFEDYLIEVNQGGLTLVNAVSGEFDKAEFVLKETQRELVGYYNSDIVDMKSEHKNENASWMGTFTYTIHINKPVAITVGYEPVIYNKLLPEKYVTTVNRNLGEYNHDTVKGTITGDNLRSFTQGDIAYKDIHTTPNNYTMLTIPNFDKFHIDVPYYKTAVFSLLIGVTNAEKRMLFNFNNIPGYTIEPTLLAMLTSGEYAYITDPFLSVFNIVLYKNNEIDPNVTLNIDVNLEVSASEDLSITDTYRVVFYVITDLELLVPEAIDRILALRSIYSNVNDGQISVDCSENLGCDSSIVYTGCLDYDLFMNIIGIDQSSLHRDRLRKQKPVKLSDNRGTVLPKTVQTVRLISEHIEG